MPRYSAHEHTRKIPTPRQPLTDLDKGILARCRPAVQTGETRQRQGDHRFPPGTKLDLRIITKRGVNAGTPTVEINGYRDVTLIERPDHNRLRILWSFGWWVEIQLTTFNTLLAAAAQRHNAPLPTIAIQAPTQ